jgi:hypothetical protein
MEKIEGAKNENKLWRNVPSVRELTKLLEREGFLWASAKKVSQKALFL